VQRLRSERRELLAGMRSGGVPASGTGGGLTSGSAALLRSTGSDGTSSRSMARAASTDADAAGSGMASSAADPRRHSLDHSALGRAHAAAAQMLDAGSGSGGAPQTVQASAEASADRQADGRWAVHSI
jgi:hypothetical protein